MVLPLQKSFFDYIRTQWKAQWGQKWAQIGPQIGPQNGQSAQKWQEMAQNHQKVNVMGKTVELLFGTEDKYVPL